MASDSAHYKHLLDYVVLLLFVQLEMYDFLGIIGFYEYINHHLRNQTYMVFSHNQTPFKTLTIIMLCKLYS